MKARIIWIFLFLLLIPGRFYPFSLSLELGNNSGVSLALFPFAFELESDSKYNWLGIGTAYRFLYQDKVNGFNHLVSIYPVFGHTDLFGVSFLFSVEPLYNINHNQFDRIRTRLELIMVVLSVSGFFDAGLQFDHKIGAGISLGITLPIPMNKLYE